MLVIIVTRWEECPTPMVFAEATCISSAAFTSKPTSRPEASLDPGEVSSNMGGWKAQENVQQFGAQDSKLQQSNAHAYVTLFLFLLECASRNPVIVSDNHTISQLRTQLQRWDVPKLHVGYYSTRWVPHPQIVRPKDLQSQYFFQNWRKLCTTTTSWVAMQCPCHVSPCQKEKSKLGKRRKQQKLDSSPPESRLQVLVGGWIPKLLASSDHPLHWVNVSNAAVACITKMTLQAGWNMECPRIPSTNGRMQGIPSQAKFQCSVWLCELSI